jgi:hypothetical protein
MSEKNRYILSGLIIVLLFGLIIVSGCTSTKNNNDQAIKDGLSTQKITTTTTPSQSLSNLDADIAYANRIIPLEIPGFVQKVKAKDPTSGTIWGDQYTLHSAWEPVKGSSYDGLIDLFTIDVYIYETPDKAREWYTGFWEKLSDSPIQVGNKQGVYHFDRGEVTIAFKQNNLIVAIDTLYALKPPDYSYEGTEGITKQVSIQAAEKTVDNM